MVEHGLYNSLNLVKLSKCSVNLPVVSVSKPHTHKLHIIRHCIIIDHINGIKQQ